MKSNRIVVLSILTLYLNTVIQAQTIFTGKPMYQITTTRGGSPLGSFTVELFPNIAPKHVRNFDSLVNLHFYDTIAFHRCIPGFVIQGGDPNSRHGPISTWGYGQPGQTTVPAEFTAAKHLRGILSAARSSNINSATSQFFICVAAAPNLNNNYSVYGRVTKGMNYVDTIVLTPKMTSPPNYTNMPLQKIEMFITAIGSNDTIPVAPALSSPPNYTIGIDTAANIQFKWNAVSDAIIYQVNISKDPLCVNDTVLLTNTSNLILNKNGFDGNTPYYWRVRTNNGGHFSPWSQIWTFHTEGITTGITGASKDSKSILIFPNPSSGKVTFEKLEKGSRFELFEPDGKQLIDVTCKESEMILNLEKKEKGIYTYRVTSTTGKVESGKLIVQ